MQDHTDAIIKAITDLDNAFVQHDLATIAAMITPDHIAVTPYFGSPLKVTEEIAAVADLRSRQFDMTDPAVRFVGDNVALITYEKSYTGTYKDQPLPKRVFTSAVWTLESGTWREDFYQETAIDPR